MSQSSTFSGLTHTVLITAIAFSFALTVSGCGKAQEKEDLSGIHSSAAPETMAETAVPSSALSKAETTGPSSSVPAEPVPTSGAASKKSVKTTVETYSKGNIKVEYPSVSGMTDTFLQKKINDLLKKNALSVMDNYPDSKEPIDQDKDTLDITCKVISSDTNRITVTYEGYYNMDGAAHPTSLFYANTVNMKTAGNLGFSDFADPYTMAGYVLSDDVILKNKDKEITAAFMKGRKDTTLEQYTQCFKNADFPLKTGLDGKTASWPDSFSYEENGEVFFTIPVAHALGDYVIVEYDPATK